MRQYALCSKNSLSQTVSRYIRCHFKIQAFLEAFYIKVHHRKDELLLDVIFQIRAISAVHSPIKRQSCQPTLYL